MMKRFFKKNAAKCAIHQAVVSVMHDQLINTGACSKQEALDLSGFEFAEEYVRWDYVREFVQDQLGEEIIPVAARFWKMTEKARREFPERALASGYGKKTAGFALVSWSPEIAQKMLEHKERVRKGLTKSANKQAVTMKKNGVPLVTHGGTLRDNSDVQDLIDPDQKLLPV